MKFGRDLSINVIAGIFLAAGVGVIGYSFSGGKPLGIQEKVYVGLAVALIAAGTLWYLRKVITAGLRTLLRHSLVDVFPAVIEKLADDTKLSKPFSCINSGVKRWEMASDTGFQ